MEEGIHLVQTKMRRCGVESVWKLVRACAELESPSVSPEEVGGENPGENLGVAHERALSCAHTTLQMGE